MIDNKWSKKNSFNRTFMELKSVGITAAEIDEASFNRTFMELKWYIVSVQQNKHLF